MSQDFALGLVHGMWLGLAVMGIGCGAGWLHDRLAARRCRRLDAAFARYRAAPTGLPGEAEGQRRGVPAFLLRQGNGGER